MYELKYIYNQHGFKFIGITKEYNQIECIVVKDEKTGLHSVQDVNSKPCYSSLIGWIKCQQ